ncbi:hypothetical protein BGP_4700 [Beggiatoa sp. PS]|nr:hypothetical protein BGP_4700 [Beggiatoa sp. PS]
MSESNAPGSSTEMPFVQHLLELRDRLLKMLLAILLILLVLMPFANQLFSLFPNHYKNCYLKVLMVK